MATDAANVLLVLELQSLSTYHHLLPVLQDAASRARNRLLIVLISRSFDPNAGIRPIQSWHDIEGLLSFIYTRTTRVAVEKDRVLLRIDVVFHTPERNSSLNGLENESKTVWDLLLAADEASTQYLPVWARSRPLSLFPQPVVSPAPSSHVTFNPSPATAKHGTASGPGRHPVVAIGGTFDHLHAGHKILLSMAAWIASDKLIVGITDDNLLATKSNRHVLESIDVRIGAVQDFLRLFRPSIEHEVVSISDLYGPTAWDNNIQALVVSKETLSGAAAIAKRRDAQLLNPLETYVIDVIAGDSDQDLAGENSAEALKAAKMSSTYIREWIVRHKTEP